MKASLLLRKCAQFEKIISIAYPNQITMFHGTDAKKLKGIFDTGLNASKPNAYNVKAVYLTADMETATRYAVNHHSNKHDYPVVLEIQLSSKRRIKKLNRDFQDRYESAYDSDYSPEDEAIRYLENDISEVFGGRWLPNGFGSYFDTMVTDLTEIKGKNIYKAIIQFGVDSGRNKQELKKKIFEVMPPGKNYDGLIEIASDGTIVLTDAYYESAHQLTYPKDLPPSTIKSVYIANIPPEIASGSIDQVKLKQKLLAPEVKDIDDDMLSCIQKYVFKNPADDEVQEIMADAIEDLRDIDAHGIYADDYRQLEEISESGDWDSFKEILEGIEQNVHDDFGNEKTLDAGTFYKFTPDQAKNIISKLGV